MHRQLTVLLVATAALLLIFFLFPDATRLGDGYEKADKTEESEVTYAAETTVSARLGEEGKTLGVSITPLAVLEDSRCPVGVQCIQAGTVRLSLHVKSAVAEDTLEIGLASAISSERERVAFIDVVPPPRAGEDIADADYVFRFHVSTLEGGEF